MCTYNTGRFSDKISEYRNEVSLNFWHSKFDFNPMEQYSSVVLKFLASSRKQNIAIKPFDINFLLKNHEPLLRQNLGETNQLKMVLAEELPQVLADISFFEQILHSLTSDLRHRILKTNSVEFATKLAVVTYSGRDRHGTPLPNMADEYVVLSMTESDFNMDHLSQKTTKVSSQENEGLKFRMSIVSSMLDQQQGRLEWHFDNDQRNHIEIYLPAAKQFYAESKL